MTGSEVNAWVGRENGAKRESFGRYMNEYSLSPAQSEANAMNQHRDIRELYLC
jgi:hypothetical protein